jgi:hypothetical protein
VDGFGLTFRPLDNPPFRIKLFGFSFIKDIPGLLKLNGLSTSIQYASRLDDHARLRIIQQHIDRDEPVLLAIGNGHISHTHYFPLARFVVGHFITVYGYNLTDELFYVYDSWIRGVYEKEIPIGNAVRSFTQFLLDWQGPVYYKLIQMDHVYMPVTYIGE